MFNIDRWQEIFEAISKNKLRTFLTGISVGSGIFILIILLGVANGFKNGTKEQFARDAATLIEFWSNKTSKEYKGLNSGRRIKMTEEDYNLIKQTYKEDIEYESVDFWKNGLATSYQSKSGNYQVIGAMPDKQFLESAELLSGRFVNQKDVDKTLKVAVIGIEVAKELFTNYKTAVGKYITTGNVNYKVIGVFLDPNERENTRLYVPYSTLTQLYASVNWGSGFVFTLEPEENYDIALAKSEAFANQVKSKLQQIHKVHPDDVTAIRHFNAVEGSKEIYQLILGMKLFFWAVGILTLIAGVVGVGNIMLIIVKERTKEIGIRKALGAQPKTIIAMILHEAIFITSISGVIGLLFGFTVLEFIGGQIKTEFILNPKVDFSIAISTVILLVIAGVVAGYFPAKYAAKIKPIIALRDE
ncbi:putative ABC transport system permease protein [Wenyingzhuangia heitensis]|uniref:ABC transport system permease protein n=1 Tax=Wenyingzhuangia heitensis TaxID=1487859 RepID=A0ABX0U9T2_9FLAO|nr:ABC transporter permease [Wenyingzhuangia heitensis]NIJ45585.1 putative ABC transport system permease protein [Wenyingzhuangia heitensis]